MKKPVLARLLAVSLLFSPLFAQSGASDKLPMEIVRGDCKLGIGGKVKVEHYYDRNVGLLNKCIPDEFNYFKNQFDLMFNFAYGEKQFGHEALKAYTSLRHKGVWGRGAVYADSDAMSPSAVKLSDSYFGNHSHTSGKPLVWINEAWMQFSFNAIFNSSSDLLHTLKLGWFPFELGRGIALGSVYGLNREGFGLNTYIEDKSAPGINLHGELMKDTISYDLYYAMFECRSKSLGDTFNKVKEQIIGKKLSPWRGVGKNNELIAGRLKWKALNKTKYGTLEFEPYGFYQSASDQKVKVIADSRVHLTTLGLAVEHAYHNFEFGIEGAFNLGEQVVSAVDLNKIEIKRQSDGFLAEQYSHILNDNRAPADNALVTTLSKAAAQIIVDNDNDRLPNNFVSKPGRIRSGYTNQLKGYMVVTDMSQKFEDINLTLAATYGFASGDENPHQSATCKTHMGFVGVHESYTGKRVKSLMFLDEMRGILSIPGALTENTSTVDNNELSFTNLHLMGFGATWTPVLAHKKWTFKPALLGYWRAAKTRAYDLQADALADRYASRFIGTELNMSTKVELLRDFFMYGNMGMFMPGQLFSDIKGMKFENSFGTSEFFDQLDQANIDSAIETDNVKQDFRISNDVAYFVNVGFNYSF